MPYHTIATIHASAVVAPAAAQNILRRFERLLRALGARSVFIDIDAERNIFVKVDVPEGHRLGDGVDVVAVMSQLAKEDLADS